MTFNVVVEVLSQTGWCGLRSELLVGRRWLEGRVGRRVVGKGAGARFGELVLGALLGGDV